MDYILSHYWLLFPLIGYLSLCLLKWQYVVRRIPYLVNCLREMDTGWPRWLFPFLHVWIPIFLIPCALVVTPFSLFRERREFWRPYDRDHMYALAAEIASDNT